MRGVSFGDFDVHDPFETAVLPLQDGKDHLNIPQAVTTNDAEIMAMISTIESSLRGATGGPIVNRTITERAEMTDYQTVISVRQRPLVSVTSITSASGGAIDISAGLDIDQNAGTIRRKLGLPFYGPFFQWLPQVVVVYVAGWGVQCPGAVQPVRPDRFGAHVGHPAWAVAAAADGRPGDDDPTGVRVRDPEPGG